MLHQPACLLLTLCKALGGGVVVMELKNYHPFARIATPYYYIAQESRLLTQVEEGQCMLCGIVVDAVAYLVVYIVHEHTLPDGQDLVESPRDVETDGRSEGDALKHLLAGEPLLVAAPEVEFVAVFPDAGRALDGHELRQSHLADACELVKDLLLLEGQLLRVG